LRVEPCGLGIEYDFTHLLLSGPASRALQGFSVRFFALTRRRVKLQRFEFGQALRQYQ
jgi:hypothetical protein